MDATPNIQTPAARRDDPESSHLAAEHVTATGLRRSQQQRTLEAVRANPGKTSAELAAITGLDRFMLARRLPELEPLWVAKGVMVTCTVTRRRAHCWWLPTQQPTDAKKAAA